MTTRRLFGRIFTGIKIALGIALNLQEHGTIKVKGLPKIAEVIDDVTRGVVSQLPPQE